MPMLMNMILNLHWNGKLDSWPINTKMGVETPSTKEKTQKRSINEARDTVMEEASSTKKSKLQEQNDEEIEVKLTQKNLNQPSFQVLLEDPQYAVTSSSTE